MCEKCLLESQSLYNAEEMQRLDLAFCISGNTSTSCDANVTIETNCFYSELRKQACQIPMLLSLQVLLPSLRFLCIVWMSSLLPPTAFLSYHF